MGKTNNCILIVSTNSEILVFITEIIAFLMCCKENTRLRKVLYVFTANFISLIAGGYIITILPI